MDQEYPYRYGAIAIIVNKDKKFLVVNLLAYREGDFDFVGGGRDGHETPIDNVYREIKEETGMSPDQFRMIGPSQYKFGYDFRNGPRDLGGIMYKGQQKDAFVLEFLGEDDEIQIQKEELREYKWVDASELRANLHFPGQYENAIKIINDVIPEYIEGIEDSSELKLS